MAQQNQLDGRRNSERGIRQRRFPATAAVMLLVALGISEGLAEPQGHAPDGSIRRMQLVAPGRGWVLTQHRLLWTDNGGKNWQSIAPAVAGSNNLDAAFFLDADRGWVVTSGQDSGGTSVEVAITADGGRTWSTQSLSSLPGADLEPYSGVASIDFVDAVHGWVMLRLASSANFSRNVLFRTSDGGQNWSRLPGPPLGDLVRFVTPVDGWLAGNPETSHLYVTRDGGLTWKERSVELPESLQPGEPVYDLPTFQNKQAGVLPVTVPGTPSWLALYRTEDGGETWQFSTAHELASGLGPGTRAPCSIIDSEPLLPSTQETLTLSYRLSQINAAMVSGKPVKLSVIRMDFYDITQGWLLAVGECASTTQCSQQIKLLATADGGWTISDITPELDASLSPGVTRATVVPTAPRLATIVPQARVNDPTSCSPSAPLGDFNGVEACSNVPSPGCCNTQTGINTGLEWQCVEYVNRFYYLYFGINLRSRWTGNADQFWANSSSLLLTQWSNGGSSPPKIGDVVTYNGGCSGHVAIVRSVTDTSVCTAQQNWSNNSSDVNGTHCMNLANVNSLQFTLPNSSANCNGTVYPLYLQGWLRLPCSAGTSTAYSVQAHPAGTIVKSPSSGTIYVLIGTGTLSKYGFANTAAFRNPYTQTYYDNQFGFEEVVNISDAEMNSYSNGGTISAARSLTGNGEANPNGKLIMKSLTSATVALVSNGQKRQFVSNDAFTKLGYKLCNIIYDDTYDSYPTGSNIDIPSASAPPTVTTGAATAVTSSNATLNGTVNPNGADTSYWFLYGTNSSLAGASRTGTYDIGSGTTVLPITGNAPGLSGGQTYYYQIQASNSAGPASGSISYFTTPPAAPTVTTGAATSVTSSSAYLNGTVNPNGAETSYWFFYGTNSSLAGASKTGTYDIGSGTTTESAQAFAPGLTGGTRYYYQIQASNSAGPASGSTQYLDTPASERTVTLQTNPSGLQVTVGGVSQSTPYTWSCTGGSISVGVASPQAGGTATQYVYSSWNDGGSQSRTINCPASSTTYTANFTTQYLLTMNAGTGGTVSAATGYYNAGQSVAISANPTGTYAWGSWTGSGSGNYTGTNQSATVTMNGPISETASFVSARTVALQTNPSGLKVTVGGVSQSTPYTWSCTSGSISVGVPSPQGGSTGTQYVYSNWNDGGSQSRTINCPASSTTYTANFTTQYLLTMNAGTGGTVSPATGYYNAGQSVTISATPTAGYTFAGWSGSGTGNYTGTNNLASVTMNGPITETGSFAIPSPQAVSVTPSTGTGSSNTFSFLYSDANGASDLGMVQVVVNSSLSGYQGCYISIDPVHKTVLLLNDGATAWQGPITLPTAGTLANSQCTINGGSSSIALSGNNATVNLALSFSSGFGGAKNVYGYAQAAGGLNSGWTALGNWTVTAGPPQAVSVTPSTGTGSSNTFSFLYSDANGASDLGILQVVVNSSLSGYQGCYISIDPVHKTLLLLNDGATAWQGPITPPTAGTLANSQCTINGGSSSIALSGNNATVNLALSFSGSFVGAKNVYGYAQAAGGLNSGWTVLGNWTVPTAVPQAVSVTPFTGTGSSNTFSFLYSDANGASDLGILQVVVNSSLSGYQGCYISIDPVHKTLLLLNDGATAWQGPITPPTAGTLANSQCTINGGSSSIALSGNNATVNLALSFSSTFGGVKNVYGYAQAAGGLNSGWTALGNWTVPAALPQAVSVTPSTGTGSSNTFSFVYSDANGASDLGVLQVVVNSSLSGYQGCYISIDPVHNTLWLLNDGATAWQGPITLPTSGTLANSQCTINGGSSSIALSGNNATANLALSFSGGFGGLKTVYGYAQAAGGINSGWTALGNWTVP